MRSALKTKKPGVGFLSTLGFRFNNLVRLSPKSNLYLGRRPKIKAVPKVKAKRGEKAPSNHDADICRFYRPMSSIKFEKKRASC
jgi:hypothetical protein